MEGCKRLGPLFRGMSWMRRGPSDTCHPTSQAQLRLLLGVEGGLAWKSCSSWCNGEAFEDH